MFFYNITYGINWTFCWFFLYSYNKNPIFSSIHSIIAIGPFLSLSSGGYAGDLWSSSKEGAPVIFNEFSTKSPLFRFEALNPWNSVVSVRNTRFLSY